MHPIFVINLDAQQRRWAFMSDQLRQLGLTAQRLPAVNGYDPAQIAEADAASFAPLPNGEIGCFESHRRAWRAIVAQDLPGAFILEDDVVVADDFAQLEFSPALLAETDVIKLDACDWTAAYGPAVHNFGAGRVLRPLWGSETSAGCYFMTQRGAQKMLRHSRCYFLPVDTMMFDLVSRTFHELTILKADPAIAVQMRYIMSKEELAPEVGDGMQEKRRVNRDPRPATTRRRRIALVLRRLRDWDFAAVRRRRSRAFLRRAEGVTPRTVTFQTDSRDHIDAALPLLDSAPS